MHGAAAKKVAEGKSNKDLYVSVLIQELCKNGQFRAAVWKDIPAPHYITEKSALRYVLELIQLVATEEEREILSEGNVDDTRLESCSRSLEKRCMEQMLRCEGVDPEVEKQTRGNKKATYLALGRRIRVYKNELKKLLGSNNADLPLQDRPPEQQATPPDHRSMRGFFNL